MVSNLVREKSERSKEIAGWKRVDEREYDLLVGNLTEYFQIIGVFALIMSDRGIIVGFEVPLAIFGGDRKDRPDPGDQDQG